MKQPLKVFVNVEDINMDLTFSSDSRDVVEGLNQCPESAMDWMRASELKLSSEEMVVLWTGDSIVQKDGVQPVLDGVSISEPFLTGLAF